ncbi:MAG: protein kinase [Chitinispirillaceae bacterium]|nr:protein kinase [Chitinispirillaceae bacterium]
MPVNIPSPDLIINAIPGIKELVPLNAGGFKAVYKANINGTWEALKLIEIPTFPDRPKDEQSIIRQEMRGRIFREIEILERVSIPELVKLGTIGKMETKIMEKDYVVYSEELIDGCDLFQIINAVGLKPFEQELCVLFVILLRAIKALWSNGYIHRDIKPANVMKTADPHRPFILMDLGIAFSIHDTALTFNASDRLPPATFKYIAPEMLNPVFRENIDYRSDLYTTAMTIYEYAAFAHPLARQTDDLMTTFSRALRQIPITLSTHRGDLSPQFCSLIDQMLKKKPALRPANLDSLISRLEAML